MLKALFDATDALVRVCACLFVAFVALLAWVALSSVYKKSDNSRLAAQLSTDTHVCVLVGPRRVGEIDGAPVVERGCTLWRPR